MVDALGPGHLCVTSISCAVVWFVQWVHYPLYQDVGLEHFERYHQGHLRRARTLLAPIFLVEGALSVGLFLIAPAWLAAVGLGAYLLGMALTATWIERVYRRLGQGFERASWRRLLQLNSWRMVLWTVRLGCALGVLMMPQVHV